MQSMIQLVNEPLISIIVPIYNMAAYLNRCIDSLLAQTYLNIEVVLINDGSTDGCGEICERYTELDKRVIMLHKENGGLVSAWQAGVKLSTGKYLCFVDCDDWVEAEMIQSMASTLDNESGEIICCNYTIDRIIREKSGNETMSLTKVKHGLPPGIYQGEELYKIYHSLLGNELRPIIISRCMKLISKELIVDNMKHSHVSLKTGEDMNIIIPVLLSTRRLVILENAYYYHYFYNNDSMVHAYDLGLYKNNQLLYSVIRSVFIEKIKERNLNITETEVEKQCGKEYILLLLSALKNEARGNPEWKNYYGNVKKICRENKNHIKRYPVKVGEMANRLLYMVLRFPYFATISLLRISTKLFYYKR